MISEGSDADHAVEAIAPERAPLVLEGAPAIVWMWEPTRGCTYVSEAWTRILGRDVAEATGEGWAASVHPDDASTFANCRSAMGRNEPYAAEYRLRRADGSYAVVNDQGFPMRTDAASGPFLGAALEVTAQREEERADRERVEALDRVTAALSSSTTEDEVADAVFQQALDALGAPNGGLGLPSADGATLTITRLRGYEEKRGAWRSIPIDDETPITRAFREGRTAFYGSGDDVERSFPNLRGRLTDRGARAALPLRADGRVLGILYASFPEARTFDDATRVFCNAVADRIGHALDRARLFDAARRSELATWILQRVTANLGGAVTIEDVERVAALSARDAVGADACVIALVDPADGTVTYAETDAYPRSLVDLLPTSTAPGSSPIADVVATGRSMAFDSSAMLAAAYPELEAILGRLPYSSRIFVPIGTSASPMGVLVASSERAARFDDDAVGLLEAIGGQCGIALQRARLSLDAHEATARAAGLHATSFAIAEATTIEEVGAHAVAFAAELLDARVAALAMLDPTRDRLRVVGHVGASDRLVARWEEFPVERLALAREVAASRRVTWRTVEDLRRDDPEAARDLEPLGVGSVLLVPLIGGGEVLGFLGVGRGIEAAPSPERRDVLDALAERISAAAHRLELLETERRTRRDLERAMSRLARLQAVSAAISQAMPVEEVASTALDASMEALNAAGGGVYLADGEVLRCLAARGVFAAAADDALDAIPIAREMAMCAAYRTGHVGWVPTLDEWRRRYPEGAAMFHGLARSNIAIPFVVEDRVLGVMSLVFTEEDVLDRTERRLGRAIGHQAAVALERSLLHEREMSRSRHTEQVQQLIAELAGSTTPVGVATSLTSTALEVVAADAAAVLLVDETDDVIEVAAARGLTRTAIDGLGADDAPGSAAIDSRRPVFLRTAEAVAERYPRLAAELGAAIAELPLLSRDRALGALVLSFDLPPRFDLEQIEVLRAIAAEAAQAIQRARVMQREREISRILQASLLPDELLSTWNGASVATWYSAGTEHLDVGGDWYDAIELPDGRLGVSIGDVVGRGLRAAAAMGQLRSALRGLALEMRGPGRTLEALNRFAATTPGTELATVAYGELDPISGSFTYACAGHPPPIAVIEGRIRLLEEGRSPLLAAGYDGHRSQATTVLPPGSTLILYTDGLIERREEPFHLGIARLRDALEVAAPLEAPALIESLIDAVLGDRQRSDDAAMLCLRTGIPTSMALSFPGQPEELRVLRARLRDWLEVRRYLPRDTDALVLAANEAAANAIEHGYRAGVGSVDVHAEAHDGNVQLTIADHGSWLERPADPTRGRGLALMRTLIDEVDVQPGDAGTTVVLRHAMQAGAAGRAPLATVADPS